MTYEPSIEQMIRELQAAGWTRQGFSVYKSPSGSLYRGPYLAWKVMRAESTKGEETPGSGTNA